MPILGSSTLIYVQTEVPKIQHIIKLACLSELRAPGFLGQRVERIHLARLQPRSPFLTAVGKLGMVADQPIRVSTAPKGRSGNVYFIIR